MSLLTAQQRAYMLTKLREAANAVVTEVADPGADDGTGDPGAPVPVWTGEASAFLATERRVRVINDVEAVEVVDTLRIYDGEGAPTTYTAGANRLASTIVIDDQRGGGSSIRRWTVRGMDRDADGTLDSVLLELTRPQPVA